MINWHRRIAFALIVAATVYCFACQPMRAVKEKPPTVEEIKGCLNQAPEALKSDRKQKCISLLERFLDRYPSHVQGDYIALQLSLYYLENRAYSAAYHLLSSFQEQYARSGYHIRAKLYLAICMLQMGSIEESLEILKQLKDEPGSEPFLKEIFFYIAENHVARKDLLSALNGYAQSYELISPESEDTRLQQRILEVMCQGWDLQTLEQAAMLFPDGFFLDSVQLGIAASQVKGGHLRVAEEPLSKLSMKHLDDYFTPRIQALIDLVYSDGQPRICTIGCLLPLSGKYGRFGMNVLDAILLGTKAFQHNAKGLSIRLLIRDSKGDPETAVAQLRALAENKEVIGVVGPLRANVAMACAEKAEELGLPLLTLTQREEVARGKSYVFQNGLTMRQQIETLTEYMMDEMGYSRFAVLYPQDAYGTLASTLFEEKVLDMGGVVTSVVSYEGKETDFQDEIRKLVGEDFWLEMLTREEERKKANRFKGELEDIQESLEEASLQWSEEGEQINLEEEEMPLQPPFEALFIPDHYRKVALIAPHLAFYDLNEITLLGTNAWNSDQLLEQAGEYVRDAVFVDGFFVESAMPSVRNFVESYKSTFQREPRVLEAQGYDSLLILEESFHQAKVKTRAHLRETLANIEGYPGLSGYTYFDQDGCAKKRLYLLSIEQNHIRQIF